MLVLTRRIDESIVIDPDGLNIVIKVLGLNDGKVRLGVDAPSHLAVHRDEIVERIERERRNRG